MKLILVRDKGKNFALHITRRTALMGSVLAIALTVGGAGLAVSQLGSDALDEQVVSNWRAKLADQEQLVVDLARKNSAQSAAVGRQLARMQARLLRMEAIGSHLTAAADLPEGEFNFGNVPAQGGPQSAEDLRAGPGWNELSGQLDVLAQQLKRRESELGILDSVLVHEDIKQNSTVRGRPIKWGWLSSPYGKRVDPISGKPAWHAGVDFAGRDGSDVVAVASGVVTFAGDRYGYGKLVEISHADGLVTRYAHHKELQVQTGDVVKKGQTVGLMGSSGRSTGPHVHFEVLKNGRTVDPAQYVGG